MAETDLVVSRLERLRAETERLEPGAHLREGIGQAWRAQGPRWRWNELLARLGGRGLVLASLLGLLLALALMHLQRRIAERQLASALSQPRFWSGP